MKTFKLIFILLISSLSISGCDWLRSKLGMATSQDIEAIKLAAERKSEEQRIIDSIKLSQIDTVRYVDSITAMINAKNDTTSQQKYSTPEPKPVVRETPKQPTTEVAKTRVEDATKATSKVAPKQAPIQTSTKPAPKPQPQLLINASFYVIVGSFKDPKNAEKMCDYLRKDGYSPIILDFKNGFKAVAAGGYNNQRDASNERNKLLEKDFSPEDVWVYDSKQNLHIK